MTEKHLHSYYTERSILAEERLVLKESLYNYVQNLRRFLLGSMVTLNFSKHHSVEWKYYGRKHPNIERLEYSDWKDIPEDHEIILTLKIVEIR